MPNRPSESATRATPSDRSIMPKVKRSTPVLMSVPTRPSIRPSIVIATPLSGEPLANVDPASRPSSISEQISGAPNEKATFAIYGAKKIICRMPKAAPKAEPIIVMPSATPPLPCLVSGKPSRQVTACGGWQGRFSRIEQMAPPYCAP